MREKSKSIKKMYNPNLGFIGNSEVKVANYIFSAKRMRKAYQHAKPIADRLLNNEVSNHYTESKKLTKFLKNRDLTFSKKTEAGEFKTFTVPCTTTVVPFEKSLFNDVETAAQRLMISLRAVLQDIYGSKNLESAKFVKHLPKDVRAMFIQAIETSSNYFPQLHNKNMKDYPFLDNVGLDLVLVEDYLAKQDKFPEIIAKNKTEELPGLPFRILEINAGSPSGASNNMNVLEGIYNQNPEILDTLGKVMPNDHFKVLGETYKSLGEGWTKRKDGIQVLLPPGGGNGAAPEIHQLAAYSGLIYTDADQLYCDKDGYIRMRTVAKENPIVTAVYSRINADSALFDPKRGLLMKDPDSAEPVYLTDDLILDEEGKGKVILDSKGNPIPLQSSYAIPGIIDAIIDRKIYMGGLNRILDNKIILATLTHYAPKFFAKKITDAGLDLEGAKILPPQTLPPTAKSAEIIANNPDEWVVKAPSLAGGQGVYILKTLPKAKREEVLAMIKESPEEFAYQQLVKIARIPVAVQRKEVGYKFANLAADIRTWVFFGGKKNDIPKMTHNALVRYAPQERGKMSSIVNTSAGGGYAPFVIIDDTNSPEAVNAKELTKPLEPIAITTDMPVFVAAQMIQVARMLKKINHLLNSEKTYAVELLNLNKELTIQLREINSFLHPRAIVQIYKTIDLLETKVAKTHLEGFKEEIGDLQLKFLGLLKEYNANPEVKMIRDILDNFRVLNIDKVVLKYSAEERALDLVLLEELKSSITALTDDQMKKDMMRLSRVLKKTIITEMPDMLLTERTIEVIKQNILNFCEQSQQRLKDSSKLAKYAELFKLDTDVTDLQFETLYLGKKDDDKEIRVATQSEMRTNTLLTESNQIDETLKRARSEWKRTMALANTINASKKEEFIAKQRELHFGKFPQLKRYQDIINKKEVSVEDMIDLMDVAPYAKFNIEHFAKEQGIEVEDLFTTSLKKNRIAFLNQEQLKKYKLAKRDHAGECFAKKKTSHGLYSDSSIYIWMRTDLDPFTALYTAGHELIHYQQIKHSMLAERRALKDGGISAAKFLNYYGNFLGANQRTVDKIEFEMQQDKAPLYGYADRLKKDENKIVMKDLVSAYKNADSSAWEYKLNEYGSLLGYIMPGALGIKVKALQEVLPALENAKNIIFAQELGLIVNANPVKAALPAANEAQVEQYARDIYLACKKPAAQWESLRVIASNQYHGISFHREDSEENNLTLKPSPKAVAVGSSYNQTQQ